MLINIGANQEKNGGIVIRLPSKNLLKINGII